MDPTRVTAGMPTPFHLLQILYFGDHHPASRLPADQHEAGPKEGQKAGRFASEHTSKAALFLPTEFTTAYALLAWIAGTWLLNM